MRSKIVLFVFASALLAATVSGLKAEVKKGMLSVAVTDAAGKNVPNAVVSIKSASGDKTVAQTTSSGFYVAMDLPPGDYDVTITAKGFAVSEARVTLAAESAERIDVALERGGSRKK